MRIHDWFNSHEYIDHPTDDFRAGDLFIDTHGNVYTVDIGSDGNHHLTRLIIDQRGSSHNGGDSRHHYAGPTPGTVDYSRSRHPSVQAPDDGQGNGPTGGRIADVRALRSIARDAGMGTPEAGA